MTNYPEISLKKGKEISVFRQHHWIFSGAVAKKENGIAEGDLIRLVDHKGEFLAIGYYAESSIAIRVLSFEERPIDLDFWYEHIAHALSLRKILGLTANPDTNVYRLVHGEGDLLPGLIIDYYNGTAVIQAHHIGIYHHIHVIADALKKAYGPDLKAVYDKSISTIPSNGDSDNPLIYGKPQSAAVSEHGHRFEIDWVKGQKTGFFIDQRENRKLLAKYAQDKKVLNTFAYSGGFSVYALKGGAKQVYSVDISAQAMEWCRKNIAANGFDPLKHPCIEADVISYLREIGPGFDLIVLDPPAFAKNIRSRHKAVQAYKRLNATAIKHIAPGGIIFTFSCSQVISRELFEDTITAASLEAGRPIKILHYLTQPADHPVNVFHQETAYLKGLVLYVS
jgi:23S rRNA (cytosine1962-C5)-methyltransferase